MANKRKSKVPLTYLGMQKAQKAIQALHSYTAEWQLIDTYLKNHPKNTDYLSVAAKVAIIDVTNSTNLARYKTKISICDVVNVIVDLALNHNLDDMIAEGNVKAVENIANGCKMKNKNLFSFATKYCCYHNICVYGKDDYSIYDNVLATYLPYYQTPQLPIKTYTINKWRVNVDYSSFNNYIANLLAAYNLPQNRRLFDNFIWKNYR